MNFESGKFFDIFKVGEKLGHGHFAEVKHCADKTKEIEYAAKFIRLRQLLDSKSIGMSFEEIEREAHILTMLNHQNIIKLFFCYDLGKHIVLVLELVSGGELFDHISDSEKLSEEEASEFIEQILLGVQHMHERKVVHLDLKPENVMIEDLEERKIKLIDFGLAREIKNKDLIIEMQGTAEFLAPEVINYNPISYSTDMWAIGVISYIMLTGVSPFSGDDQFSTFQNIVNCRLDFDEDVCSDMSEMAKSFINSLLVLDSKERATASVCLTHPWIKPIEQASVFRRRSSIISRDKLQSLKQFVVYPSPPSSGAVTPCALRKSLQQNDLFEDAEDSWDDTNNDEDLVLLNDTPKETKSTLESMAQKFDFQLSFEKDSSSAESSNEKNLQHSENKLLDIKNSYDDDLNVIKDHDDIKNASDQISKETMTNNNFQKSEAKSNCKLKTVNEVERDVICRENSVVKESSSETSENSLSQEDSLSNSTNSESVLPVSTENTFKQKFNNTIANSVKKFNSKFESITSLFDSKNRANSLFSGDTKRRGSLKNSTKINSGLLLSNSEKNKQLLTTLTTERSTSYDGSVKFISASVTTSPTIMKKSVFVSRYMAHIEKKN